MAGTTSAARAGRVYVASDEPGRPEVRAVADAFGGEVLLGLDSVATWQFGATCKHLVLSDSTFSWAVAGMHARPKEGSRTPAAPAPRAVRVLARASSGGGAVHDKREEGCVGEGEDQGLSRGVEFVSMLE